MRDRLRRWAPLLASLGGLLIAAAIYAPQWLSEGSGMRLHSPLALLGWLAVPAILAMALLERRFAGRVRHPLLGVILASGAGWRVRLVPLAVALRVVGVALLVVALARPQDSTRPDETELEGIDIVVTLDVSGSMKAEDLAPSRLEAAKAVVQDFIRRRKNDRIGAVVFAENAYTLCPLTLDYSILSSMVGEVELGVIEGNATAIGNALGVAINRLRKSDAKSKVIILLTDGSSNAGNITPEQATRFAETLGIKIYTVLIGLQDDAPVTTGFDFFKQRIFGTQNMPVNRELLVQMSEQTGGAYFEATDGEKLVSSFHAILDALERSRVADRGVVWAEMFGRYLWPGLFLIGLELLLGLFVLRRVP